MTGTTLHFAAAAGGVLTEIRLSALGEDDGIALAVMGMLVVFAALLLISLFISLLPRMLPALAQYYPEQEDEKLAVAAPPWPEDELSEELMVVIAAAVAEVCKQPHRIVHTRELKPGDLAWSFEGRRQQHASHRTRTRARW